ncbi:MAG: tetratricopeptide repeat protein [Planctomycetaceae bacterium]|nr:tetratricopeptide repeat protein [Planctomycetaceae bacterium]
MPRIKFLAGTLAAIAVIGAAGYFVHAYQVERMADSLRDRAESLAAEKRFGDAAGYYYRYLRVRPDDDAARVRLAEVFDQSATSPRRAVELYQAALGTDDAKVSAQTKLVLRGRLIELLLDGGAYAAAESEAARLCEAERSPAADRNPSDWRGPGLKAMAIVGQFRAKNAAVSRSTVEQAFQQVLEPGAGEPQVYKDPRVYLARYEYRLQQRLPAAGDDLKAALRLAPDNVDVLLAAAAGAHRDAVASKSQQAAPPTMKAAFADAKQYYDRIIATAASDPRGYLGLGKLLLDLGDADRAVQTWQSGLKAAGQRDVAIHLSLIDVLIQSGRLQEAETTLQSLDETRSKLRSQAKMVLQPLVDLRRAQIAVRRGENDKAILLVTDLAGDNDAIAQSEAGQGAVYQAWLVLGTANVGLKRWDQALAAYDQAITREPRQLGPRLAAVAACVAAGRRSAAIRYCQQALTAANAAKASLLWERQLIYQQLIALLEQASRRDEAERYRQLCADDIADSPELSARWAEENIWSGRPDAALAFAERGAKNRPADPAAHFMLGSAWWAKGETAKAKAAFQKAVQLAGEDVRSLQVLFQFSADTGDVACARETLGKIAHKAGATDAQRLAVLADGYAKLGDVPQTREACQRAMALAADDLVLKAQLADVLLRLNDIESARDGEKVLRQLVNGHPPARRRLAEVLLARGTLAAVEEAEALLAGGPDSEASNENRLFLATVLARRGDAANVAKAEAICRRIVSGAKKPVPVAQLVLAQVEQLQGQSQKARDRYRAIADANAASAAHVAWYLEFLIQQGPSDEVERRLKQLEGMAKSDVVVPRLQAAWLRKQGRTSEIEKVVEKWAAQTLTRFDVRRRVQIAEQIGDLYQRAGQPACAERWYRRVVHFVPSNFGPLTLVLAEQGRIAEALTLCEEAGKTDVSPRAAIYMCKLLAAGWATPENVRRCEPWLTQAVEKHGQRVDLLTGVAGIRILQGNANEAIRLCRRILSLQPEHFGALNNLAALLSESTPEDRREARQCIERAIQLFGPTPGLLDTKGTVLLSDREPAGAIELFKKAAAGPMADPRCQFHLAVAYSELGRLDDARNALKQARKTKLERHVLTQAERNQLAALEKRLGI